MEAFYDIIVIGSGPGGQQAALAAAKAGKRVLIVERERDLGGACVHQGTIPSKTLREAAITISNLKRSAEVFEFSLRKDLEVSTMIERMDSVVRGYTQVIEHDLIANDVDIVKGRARLEDPQTVVVQAVDGRIVYVEAQKVILATGSRPRHCSSIHVDHEYILDSDSILSILYLPQSLTIIGSGIIGSEYASIFSMLGVQVTLIDETPYPLAFLDPEISGRFVDEFQRNGSRFLGQASIRSAKWNGVDAVVTELESGEQIISEKLLLSSGRVANVEGLGIEKLGMRQTARGHIAVDENYETSVPGVFAVGDVIGQPSLASTSMEQGRRAVAACVGIKLHHCIEQVPIGIYAVPEIASVGIDEPTAIERYGESRIAVGRADFDNVARGQIMGIKNGLLKMIAEKDTGKLLGVQIIGDGATEIIHVGEMAIINGNNIRVFLDNILNFPTLSEAYRIAALDLLGGIY